MNVKLMIVILACLIFTDSTSFAARSAVLKEYDTTIVGELYFKNMYWIETDKGRYEVRGTEDPAVMSWLREKSSSVVTMTGRVKEMEDGQWIIYVKLKNKTIDLKLRDRSIVCGNSEFRFDDTSNGYNVEGKINLPDGTINYLVQGSTGGTTCNSSYKILTISGKNCKITDWQETCGPITKYWANDNVIHFSQPWLGSGAKGRTIEYIYTGGKIKCITKLLSPNRE